MAALAVASVRIDGSDAAGFDRDPTPMHDPTEPDPVPDFDFDQLVVAEVALAVLIAAGAALLGRSVANLYAINPHLRTEGVGVIDVTLERGQTRERLRQTIDELTTAITEQPGVRSTAAAQKLPLTGGGYNVTLEIEGRSDLQNATTEYRMVTPGYLEAMGLELRSGRTITAADREGSERVVVINEALVRKYFSNSNPIGQRLGGDGEPARIVGVVADAAERRFTDEAVPVRYVAIAQMAWVDEQQSLVFEAASDADPATLLEAARRTVERIAPGVAVRSTTTMSHVLATAVGPARQVMSLLSLLTGLALVLGAVGIYGVIAHFAGRRRREWAIRIALGLPGSRAITRVVGHAALLVAAGIGIGILAATVLARMLSALLYGVGALDPIAFAAAGTTLLAIGLACRARPRLARRHYRPRDRAARRMKDVMHANVSSDTEDVLARRIRARRRGVRGGLSRLALVQRRRLLVLRWLDPLRVRR